MKDGFVGGVGWVAVGEQVEGLLLAQRVVNGEIRVRLDVGILIAYACLVWAGAVDGDLVRGRVHQADGYAGADFHVDGDVF